MFEKGCRINGCFNFLTVKIIFLLSPIFGEGYIDYQLKIKLIPLLNKLDAKKVASLGNLSKNALFEFIKNKWKIDAKNIIKDVEIDLALFSNKIFCFDDLERCKIPLPEVLGYINDYVEHKNLKVVFLSNEKEISKKNLKDN